MRDQDTNDFEDEPSAGGGYDRAFALRLHAGDGIARRIVVRLRRRPPQAPRVAIVLEQVRAGTFGTLMRYDDAHGRFHRHAPGWPVPGERIETFLDAVPVRDRAAYAVGETQVRYTAWEAEVFGREGAGER